MMRRILLHMIGGILFVSTIYHSNTLYSLLGAVPLFLISYLIETERYRFLLPALTITTLILFIFIKSFPVNEVFPLIIFALTFAYPLSLYWLIGLSAESDIRWGPTILAGSYVLVTFAVFYLLPQFIGVSGFILGEQNKGVQILIFLGSGMLIGVIYHAVLEIKD